MTLTKIPLFFLLFASSLMVSIPSSSKMCVGMARAAEVRAFGQTGSNAGGGVSGNNGKDSDNLTIFADGSPLTLNLAG